MTTGEQRLMTFSVAGVTATGLVYWVMKDLMPRRDPFSVLGHPWQPHVLAAHLLIAPLVVFAFGLLYRDHIAPGWRHGVNGDGRRSGVLVVLLALPMIASGYGLQVSSGETLRRVLALLHLVSGTLFGASFAVHLVRAWRRRAAGSDARAGARAGRVLIDPGTGVRIATPEQHEPPVP